MTKGVPLGNVPLILTKGVPLGNVPLIRPLD
jgi:hypothetical protein